MTHHLDPISQTTKVTPLADEDDQDEQGGDDLVNCIMVDFYKRPQPRMSQSFQILAAMCQKSEPGRFK